MQTESNLLTATNPIEQIISLAKMNDQGEKNTYSTISGMLNEYAEDFLRLKKPFAFYKINDTEIVYVNKEELSPDQKELIVKVRMSRTGFLNIFYIEQNKRTTIPVTYFMEEPEKAGYSSSGN